MSNGALSGFQHGAKSAIGTTAVVLSTGEELAGKGILVKAASGNGAAVFVGRSASVTNGSSDATDGFELTANQGLEIETDETGDVFLIAASGSQKVYWMAV